MAPEVSRKIKVHKVTEKADIFSLGCILYYLLTGKDAFTGNEKDEKDLAYKIETLQRRIDRSHKEFSLLFKYLIQIDPAKRWSYNDIASKEP
jgi:serine/threonine protein kinase